MPLINGTSGPARLQGAQLTAVDISWICLDEPGCLRRWRNLARSRGFAGRLSLYLCDEPLQELSLWEECRTRDAKARRQAGSFPNLVTTSIRNASEFGGGLLSRIRTIVPVVNEMVGRTGSEFAGNQRPSYSPFLKSKGGSPKRRLWFYTSCLSHGCEDTEATDPSADGRPGYVIDQPASQARAPGWLAFEYGVSGELYFQTTQSLSTAWQDQYVFGGHGDGTLFYPGSVAGLGGAPAIGGTHDIPIESIRLKRASRWPRGL